MIHVIAICFGFAVFFGICNIILLALCMYRNTGLAQHYFKLEPFFCAFFIYGFCLLIVYYNVFIIGNTGAPMLLAVLGDIAYLFMLLFWAYYIAGEDLRKQGWIGYAFCAVWLVCGVMWVSEEFLGAKPKLHELYVFVNMSGSVLEWIVVMLLVILCIRMGLRRARNLHGIIGSCILIAYQLKVLIMDGFISLHIIKDTAMNVYELEGWPSLLIFCLAINLLSTVFLFSDFKKDYVKSNDNENKNINPVDYKYIAEKHGLSKREAEILPLIIEGLPNAEIAEKSFISENTVKKHVHNVYAKTSVSSRVELITKFNSKMF